MEIKQKKLLRKVQTAFTVTMMVVAILMVLKFRDDKFSEDKGYFWLSAIIFFPALLELVLSIILKQSVSKGIIIEKSKNPLMYTISVAATMAICIICAVGLIAYW